MSGPAGQAAERWRYGPHKHVARKWHSPDGSFLKCEECGWDTGCDGTIREKEDRFREHRSSMGEAIKPQRVPAMRDRLAQAVAEVDHLRTALTEIASFCRCQGTDCAASIARAALAGQLAQAVARSKEQQT